MKRLFFEIATIFVAGVAEAATVCPTRLPSAVFADGEVSESYVLPRENSGIRGLEVRLAFEATPSNCVEVAFGRDGDGDGVLEGGEVELAIGWDCGHWRARGHRVLNGAAPDDVSVARTRVGELPLGEVASEAATTNGYKRFVWQLELAHRGVPQSLVATENGAAIFGEVGGMPPSWLFDREWDLMRVTARGVDAPNEEVRVKLRHIGFAVIVK